jgi:hypothetical protein
VNPEVFEATTDERTLQEHNAQKARVVIHGRRDEGLIAKMRTFVDNFMWSKGKEGMIEARSLDGEDIPVLRPKKGMRYRYQTD